MLEQQNVILRSVEEEDLEQLRVWRNHPDLRKYFREYRELSKADQLAWYTNFVLPKQSTLMFSIVERESNKLLGACGLCYIDWLRKSADLSIYIGYNGIYLDEIYAVESAKSLIKYGFGEIGLHRLWAEVYSHDLKKQEFFKSLGFTLEGTHRETQWSDGMWLDSLYFGLLESD